MTVVLDWTATEALASGAGNTHNIVGDLVEREVCYMAPAAVVAMYGTLYDKVSEQAAEYWLRVVAAGTDIRVMYEGDAEFLEDAGKAALVVDRLLATGFSAALAKKLGVPLVTNIQSAAEFARTGFCEVRFF